MKKICIVTTRHISYNPRVLKEADALKEKGYEVVVITVSNHYRQRKFDEELMQTRCWKLKTVNFCKEIKNERPRWLYFSVKQKLFERLSHLSLRYGIAERAMSKAYTPLLTLAVKEKAHCYLTHHPEALAIGFKASRKNKARFGFDAEDFHTGMNESSNASGEEALTEYLERKYLPFCHHLTAASKGISEAYAEKYNIKKPQVLLNVFPEIKLPAPQLNSPVKFYWYSQTIGPNRNLEFLIKAASLVNDSFEVHLRGSFQNQQYFHHLTQLINSHGLKDKFYFHKPIRADAIISDAHQFDVGMALESNVSFNRNICVTNKTFSYLMSGLAIIGTDTCGQKDIFANFPDAVYVCKMNDEQDLASGMRYYIQHPAKLYTAKKAARRAAENEFNWERESKKFLTKIESLFAAG